jgi:hypothetical protein
VFFYVDESGHTGANLFDENQPILYYGVLSAKTSLDILAEPYIKSARKQKSVEKLHASELGVRGLVDISDHLIFIQKKYQPRFDVYQIAKADHAVICFFDQVFDQAMNPAMTWTGYWTPLRYVLLTKLASLFDDKLAKSAWMARIDINDKSAEERLVSVCRDLLPRLTLLPDARSRQLLSDSLQWTIQNPHEIRYNCKTKKEILTITPNIIGFQAVMHGIASRLKKPEDAKSIIIDQQSQFNKAQRNLAEFYSSARQVPWLNGPGLPKMDLSKIPFTPITFLSGKESVGLELVDCYLWIFKRILEGKKLAPELVPLVKSQLFRGRTDEISISSIASRWSRWLDELPDPTEEQITTAKDLLAKEEKRRLKAINS